MTAPPALAQARARMVAASNRLASARDTHNELAYELAERDLMAAQSDFRDAYAAEELKPCECGDIRAQHLHGATGVLGCLAPGCPCGEYRRAA